MARTGGASKGGWLQAGFIGVLGAAMIVGALVIDPGEGTGSPAGEFSDAAADQGEQAVAATTTTVDEEPTQPVRPVDDNNAEGMMYGWGTAQPANMAATVHYGGSNEPISRERRQLLGEQLVLVREAAMRYPTVAAAEAAGYRKNFQRINGRGFEYINWDLWSDELDLTKPTLLAFEDDQPDSRLVSVAHNVLGSVEDGPPTLLPLELIPWHFHSNLCRKGDSIIGSVEFDQDGKPYQRQIDRCEAEGATYQPELDHWMVDLWVIPGWENPWGLVSSKHPDLMFEPTPWFDSDTTGVATAGDHQH